MNPLQLWHLKRLASKLGVDIAEIDPSLTYAENKAHLQSFQPEPVENLSVAAAKSLEEQFEALSLEQREEFQRRAEEAFRSQLGLPHPAFRGLTHTLKIWLGIDLRRAPVAFAFLRKWGVRYEWRHGTYRYPLKNILGATLYRNVQRCPPMLGVRMDLGRTGFLRDKLQDQGIYTRLLGTETPPFLGVKWETQPTFGFASNA